FQPQFVDGEVAGTMTESQTKSFTCGGKITDDNVSQFDGGNEALVIVEGKARQKPRKPKDLSSVKLRRNPNGALRRVVDASVCGLIEGAHHSRSRLLISTLDLVAETGDGRLDQNRRQGFLLIRGSVLENLRFFPMKPITQRRKQRRPYLVIEVHRRSQAPPSSPVQLAGSGTSFGLFFFSIMRLGFLAITVKNPWAKDLT
ncbi:hypothetical protein U1Q18_011593, partial [Sarracenia purpurea var. burkii]